MQKISRFSTNKNFLPNIYGDTPKNNCRSISYKHHKENVSSQNQSYKIGPHHDSTNRFNKISIVERTNSKQKDIKLLCFQQKIKLQGNTRRKFSRPWIDQQIDFNQQTIKNNHLQSIIQKQVRKDNKNTIQRNSILQKVHDDTLKNFEKTKTILQNKSKGIKSISERNDSISRDKISSCKIAMKKGVFPLNKKHYEQLKINEYFEQSISIINKNDHDETNEQFISVTSFLNIIN